MRTVQVADAAIDPPGQSFADWCNHWAQRSEQALAAALPDAHTLPAVLHEGMRYAVLGGGKRVRPLLVYAAGELVGAAPAVLDAPATAVELIHAYSLVHDDLPCMDNDVLRRGKPTVHVAFGEANAMLVGDALHALAFEVLAHACGHGGSPASVVVMLQCLGRAAGSLGMAGGQAIDLAAVGAHLDAHALEAMHQRKTGAMLRASIMMGAACGRELSASEHQALEKFAAAIGLAFQVVDDVLDVEADAATLGKTAGKDALQGKPTYVSVLGLDRAKELAEDLRRRGHEALGQFDSSARRLRELTDLIVLRRS